MTFWGPGSGVGLGRACRVLEIETERLGLGLVTPKPAAPLQPAARLRGGLFRIA